MPCWAGFRVFVVAGLTASAVLSSAGLSQGYAGEAAKAPAGAPATTSVTVPATLIQLRSFMAPVARPGVSVKPCLRAVTMLVEVDESETRNVCSFLPRIRDAVLVELFSRPIVMDGQAGMEVESAAARLVVPLNKILGKDMVRRVYLIPGSELVAEETAAQLPLNRVIGCQQRRSGRG